MISIERIVCPLDFSDVSHNAFDHALALARHHDARVTAVHVAPPSPGAGPPGSKRRRRSRVVLDPSGTPGPSAAPPEAAAHALDRIVEPARRVGVKVDPVLLEGGPVRKILERAERARADLLVMGTNGSEDLEHLVMGSVAEQIVRKAPCPVLTISPETSRSPRPPDPGYFDRIVCAVDFSEASLRALEYAFSLAADAESEIAVLHVLSPPVSSLLFPGRALPHASDPQEILATQSRLEALLPANAPGRSRPTLEIRVGRPHEQILRFARERHAQAIVMGVHGRGRGLVERLFLGSVTNRVVRGGPCPVLSVHGEARGARSGGDDRSVR